MPPNCNGKNERSVENGDNVLDSVSLDLRPWYIRIGPKVRKVSDEIVAAPLPTRVNVVANEDAWKRFRSHGLNPHIWLRHEVDQGTEGKLHTLEAPLLVPLVPSGITVDDGNVVGETEMFTSERPKRRGIETRLNNRTTATLLASTDAILGDTVGLRHPRGSSAQTPFQRRCR